MLEQVKLYYQNKGIRGDDLLDILDIAEDLIKRDVKLTSNGGAILFHATSLENASTILSEQKMYGKENGLFFSTSPYHQIKGYGSVVIAVEIPIHELILDDEFSTEQHYRVEVPAYKKKELRAYLYEG